jgi:hypothetical protein
VASGQVQSDFTNLLQLISIKVNPYRCKLARGEFASGNRASGIWPLQKWSMAMPGSLVENMLVASWWVKICPGAMRLAGQRRKMTIGLRGFTSIFFWTKNQEFPCSQRSRRVDVIFDTVDDFLIGTVVVPGKKFARHGGADQAPSLWTKCSLC